MLTMTRPRAAPSGPTLRYPGAAPADEGRREVGEDWITAEELADLRAGRLSQADLARAKNLTPMTVSRRLKKLQGAPVPVKNLIAPFLPWTVSAEHKNNYKYRTARDHLRVTIADDQLTDDRARDLRNMYAKLRGEDLVLVYNPRKQPNREGLTGGFQYVPRRNTDEDLIIRVPDPEWWTDERKAAWRFPKDLPEG